MTHLGELAALGSACCFAAGSNLFAAAGMHMGAAALNRLRLAVAFVLLLATLALTRGTIWPAATGGQFGWLAASGLVGFVFGDAFYFRSLVALGPGRAQLLASLVPIFTVILGWPVLGEIPGPLALLGMLLILAGIVTVLREHARLRPEHAGTIAAAGVAAGVLGAVGQAGGFILSKLAVRTGIDPIPANAIRVAVAAAAIWALTAAQGDLSRTVGTLRHRRSTWFMLAGTLFGPFLGVILVLIALQRVETGVVASITAFSPVLAILISSRFHGEPITARIMIGALVSVAGVVVLFAR